jgi:Integrase core domain
MGIRDRPISPGSPWQNGYVERLIGTLRRECLDHVLIIGARHLRQILVSYATYYNQARTHLALQKDAPLFRTVRRCGRIVAIPILSGLHHQYVRIGFSEGTGFTGALKPIVFVRTPRPMVVSLALCDGDVRTGFWRQQALLSALGH